jgi:hypothetical protein
LGTSSSTGNTDREVEGRNVEVRSPLDKAHSVDRGSTYINPGSVPMATAMAVSILVWVGLLGATAWAASVEALHVLMPAQFELDQRALGRPAIEEPLMLRGAPGDRILVSVLEGETRKRASPLFLRLTTDDGDFQTTLPAPVVTGSDGDKPEVRARVVVPGVPGKPNSHLTGTLWGDVELTVGNIESVEVPVDMQVFPAGAGHPSGFQNNLWPHVLWSVASVASVLAGTVLTASAYHEWRTNAANESFS